MKEIIKGSKLLMAIFSLLLILGCNVEDMKNSKIIINLEKDSNTIRIRGKMTADVVFKKVEKIKRLKDEKSEKEFVKEFGKECYLLGRAFNIEPIEEKIKERTYRYTLSYGFYTFYDLMDNIVKNLFDLGNVKINFLENKKEVIMDIEGNINNVNPFEKIELISKIPLENNADKKEDNKFVWILKGKSHKKIFIKIKKDSLSNNKK